jgi:hypothetical protein
MSAVRETVLETIGDTALVPLRNVVPENGAHVLLKLESANPTGSMKDRMALAIIEAAEADGRLPAGGAVVEYTGGSTGVSLALVCAVKRHPLHIVTSDAFSEEKLDHMRILGANLQIVPSDAGRMTEKLTKDSPPCCPAVRRAHTRSTASVPATSFRCGETTSRAVSSWFRPRKPPQWHCGWLAKKGCSLARRREPT